MSDTVKEMAIATLSEEMRSTMSEKVRLEIIRALAMIACDKPQDPCVSLPKEVYSAPRRETRWGK